MTCNSCDSPQPEKVRLVRNVNAQCDPCPTIKPRSCSRTDWLNGIDCACCGITDTDLSDCQIAVEQGAVAKLCAVFKDSNGQLVDPIEPRITIKNTLNNIFLSSQSMTKESTGKYFFFFGTNGTIELGKWTADITGVIKGITVRTTYFFCVLRVGTIPTGMADGYGMDGYGDGYGADGYGITDGYGTFAGREECGFDGKSKDIPATGGCRTNRNGIGDGFWDGISNECACVTPIGKRGQCMKDRTVAMLRVKLKDIVPECWAFSEDEIDMFLETSLSDFNATPTFTFFTWDTLPEIYLAIIAMGGHVWALYAQGLLEAGREFNITDNGIAFTPPQISGYMQTMASSILAAYTDLKEKIKANIKPGPAGIGTFRVLSLLPQLSRLRHLRSKQIV